MIEGLSFAVFRRVATMIMGPAAAPRSSAMEMLSISSIDLSDAQRIDASASSERQAPRSRQASGHGRPKGNRHPADSGGRREQRKSPARSAGDIRKPASVGSGSFVAGSSYQGALRPELIRGGAGSRRQPSTPPRSRRNFKPFP